MNDAEAAAWKAEFAQLRALLAEVKAQLGSNPASRPEAERFARQMIANSEHLRSLCSRIHSIEYHEFESEYSDLMDEARELIE